MNLPTRCAFTRIEILVALVVLASLAFAAWLTLSDVLKRSICYVQPMLMRQLHSATQQMAFDGERTENTSLGWPGDTGGSFTNWMTSLVPAYLSTNEFCYLLSGTQAALDHAVLPTANTNYILVYAVSGGSSGDTVFLTTSNFTNTPNGGVLTPSAITNAKSMFFVLCKDGGGAVLKSKQAGKTNLVGSYAPLCR